MPVRVRAPEFKPGRSLRRIEARNADLTASIRLARGTAEQYALFQYYLDGRHGDGEMVGMGLSDYRSMVEDSSIDTRLVEFRDDSGRLIACALTDWTRGRHFGRLQLLRSGAAAAQPGQLHDHLAGRARRSARGLRYVYLGYWIGESRKMAYKTRFRPVEVFGPQGWQPPNGQR